MNSLKKVLFLVLFALSTSSSFSQISETSEYIPYSCKEIIEDSATLEKWRKETDALFTMLQSRYGYDAIPRDMIDSIRLEREKQK